MKPTKHNPAYATAYTQAYREWVASLEKAARGKPGVKRREARATLTFLKAHNVMAPSLAKTKCVDDDDVENPFLRSALSLES